MAFHAGGPGSIPVDPRALFSFPLPESRAGLLIRLDFVTNFAVGTDVDIACVRALFGLIEGKDKSEMSEIIRCQGHDKVTQDYKTKRLV